MRETQRERESAGERGRTKRRERGERDLANDRATLLSTNTWLFIVMVFYAGFNAVAGKRNNLMKTLAHTENRNFEIYSTFVLFRSNLNQRVIFIQSEKVERFNQNKPNKAESWQKLKCIFLCEQKGEQFWMYFNSSIRPPPKKCIKWIRRYIWQK